MSESDLKPCYITEENVDQAIEAVRDILYLYHDAVTSYGGFGPDLATGGFDALFFIRAELREPPGFSFALDTKLLHQGAAVSLLAGMLDELHCSDALSTRKHSFGGQILRALRSGMFDHLPIAREAAQLGFTDQRGFEKELKKVYRIYVLKYYRTMWRRG